MARCSNVSAPSACTPATISRASAKEADRVWAEFVDCTSGARRAHVEADVLVGCEGIHSVLRQALFPHEGSPKWNGITMWGAVTEGAPFLSGRTMVMAGHFARHMVAYPISRQHEAEGKALINWVAGVKNAPDQPMPTQDWGHTTRREDVLEPFKLFVFDFLDVPALIRGAATIYQYPMVDRDPLPTWHFGRVTLLGEAAHPMYPVGSNGASQAILDARVLAQKLALQAIGVDEWAWRRGHRYGTILVDLATHRVIDLLPDRAVTTVAAWLAQHPTSTGVRSCAVAGLASSYSSGGRTPSILNGFDVCWFVTVIVRSGPTTVSRPAAS
jgi:2-polyprenyl-6-methoxyphenol hydroxylase-like FAD-dependent oxidoreductase